VVLGVGAVVVIGGAIIGIRQYRSVMRPIARLSDGVRSIATGNFSRRINTVGDDREFAELGRDFNRMATELESLYRELDQKVAIKSRQLLRSERLASVGFLAAGVAHEINNPLGIIAGFGERAIQQLDDPRAEPATQVVQARQALKVICEEAFRCKGITDRLLSLARPGDETRTAVSLDTLVGDVVSNLVALKQYADRKVDVKSDAPDDLIVQANPGEIRQVILNLLLNALEATAPAVGQIQITIARRGAEVELSIRDNGRGMTPQTIEHLFEPFFTEKRNESRGTGLGLSITHAIVAAHGGSIHAESAGPQQGSCFIVRLPASL
jgi:signal transduction histidine kinase